MKADADRSATTRESCIRMSVAQLIAAQPHTLHLRDGEVVVYRRNRSLLYQCRFKLADGSWHRVSTRKASIERAVAAVCELYDEVY